MTRLILLLVLFSVQHLSGQVVKPTKVQLHEIFKSSVHQGSKRKIQTDSSPWLICNKDSSFYKADTVYLYDNQNYYYQPENCCGFIGWTFYKPNAIVQKEIQICNEPPTAKVTTDKDFYTISVTEENKQAIIKVFRKKELIDIFTAVAFENVRLAQKGQTSNRLTLVRQKSTKKENLQPT